MNSKTLKSVCRFIVFFVFLCSIPHISANWEENTEEQLVEEIEEVVVIERVAVEVPPTNEVNTEHYTTEHQTIEQRPNTKRVQEEAPQREESGEDIQGDNRNLIERLLDSGREHFDSFKAAIERELRFERLRGLWERKDKFVDLIEIMKQQNSILWVILLSLPFVVYGVLLPEKVSSSSLASPIATVNYVEYGLPGEEEKREFTQQQINHYTELQLKNLDLYCNASEASPKDKEIYRLSLERIDKDRVATASVESR